MKGNLAMLKIETDVHFALKIHPVGIYPIDTLTQMHEDICRIFLVNSNKRLRCSPAGHWLKKKLTQQQHAVEQLK